MDSLSWQCVCVIFHMLGVLFLLQFPFLRVLVEQENGGSTLLMEYIYYQSAGSVFENIRGLLKS